MTARFYKRSLSLISVFLTAISLSAEVLAQRSGGTGVAAIPAKSDTLSATTRVAGRVVAGRPFAVTAGFGARIEMADIERGDRLEKGAVIARLDSSDLDWQLRQMELQINEADLRVSELSDNLAFEMETLKLANEQLALLDAKYQRAKALADRRALASEAVDNALASLLATRQQNLTRQQSIARLSNQIAQAEASKKRLELQAARLRDDLREAEIRAPVAGQIIDILSIRSGFVREGEVIVRLRALDDYEIEADIPSGYLRFLRQAGPLEATAETGPLPPLKLRMVLPEENQRTGTRPARFSVSGSMPWPLRADGAPVSLNVPVSNAEPVILVPQDAIMPVAGGHIVFIADKGTARRQIVKLGGVSGSDVIILSGVAENEMVITRGNEVLNDGAAVRLVSLETFERPKTVAAAGETQTAAAEAPKKLPTELADDAVSWKLEWTTPRGDASADLILSSKANLFNGEPIEVTKNGDNLLFAGELVLPFGILTLNFDGKIDGTQMAGQLKMSGLPNGREPQMDFTGKVQ